MLLLGEGDAAQWGQPASGAEAPAGHPVTAQVLDATGRVVDRVTVHRTDYGHGHGASLELPTPRAGWAALALQNADGTAPHHPAGPGGGGGPVPGPGRAGPPEPGQVARPLGRRRGRSDPVGLTSRSGPAPNAAPKARALKKGPPVA